MVARKNPQKYAPPSPKNICPFGKFTKKNPNKININNKEKLYIKLSLTNQPIKANVDKIIIKEPLARPLNPSMIFIEFETPEIAKIVKINEQI